MPVNNAPKLKQCARRLLEYEAAAGVSADVEANAAFRVCEKLRGPLSKLMGSGGFRSLFCRALVLAGAEVPWLAALKIKADGTLEGIHEAQMNLDGAAAAVGETVLVAQLLGLLVTFIGPALTLRLLHDVWPDLDDLKI